MIKPLTATGGYHLPTKHPLKVVTNIFMKALYIITLSVWETLRRATVAIVVKNPHGVYPLGSLII